ncbi:MAG: COQ9 family protein [Pseudomonadota bacterium]
MTFDTDPSDAIKDQLLDAILPHVPFDGWSETSFQAALADSDVDATVARATCPRGAVDLAVAFHERGDRLMVARLKSEDLSAMRFRDRVAAAVRFRLEAAEDKDAVRRGATLFALPMYAADGAKLIWGTADLIWDTLGDSSDDLNWYTKRATLSGVYSSTVLYWLGDESPENQRTWRFLDRRIDDVMQIEKLKSQVEANPILKPLASASNWAFSWVKPPNKMRPMDFPGSFGRQR